MSTFADNPNVAYELHTFDGDEDIMNVEMNINITRSRFKWINKLIMYICCVPRLPSGKPTSKSWRFVATFFNISVTLLLLTYFFFKIYELTFNRSNEENGSFYAIIVLAYIVNVMYVLLRMSVIYYFHFHFNYPWNLKSKEIEQHQSYSHSKCTSKFYIFIIATSILLQLGFLSIIEVLSNYSMVVFICIFIMFIPIFVLLIIQSVVTFKYQRYLLQLISNIDNVDLGVILIQYKGLYHGFKIDYPAILQFNVHLQIIPVLALFWLVSYDYVYNQDFVWPEIIYVTLNGVSIIILYVSSGCYVSETLELLQKCLWKRVEENVDKNDLSIIESMVIIYTMNHPIHITFGGIRVTKRNTLMFVAGFIASRIAAKLIAMLY